jgi:hypothetical protein
MFRRNIDFLAVLVIAVAMAGFSKARTLRFEEPGDLVRWDNAANVDQSCPLQHAFSEIAQLIQ